MKRDSYIITVVPGSVRRIGFNTDVPLNRAETAEWMRRILGGTFRVKAVRRSVPSATRRGEK